MNFPLSARDRLIEQLWQCPGEVVSGCVNGNCFDVRLSIPNYAEKIQAHYHAELAGPINNFLSKTGMTMPFTHFGIEVDFRNPVELDLHDGEMTLVPEFRCLVDQYGAVILRNACLPIIKRSMGHRNRFPHLNFHIDRSRNQSTRYSLFSRDPHDPEQVHPRESSTLFIPNLIAILQNIRENGDVPDGPVNLRTHYELFLDERVSELFGKIVLQHAWDAPEGIGEISSLDNQTTFHSSYYRTEQTRAYRIGVRYLR